MEYKETKNVRPSNNDKISVILINDIIDKPISKFIEKVKDVNIFSFGISFVKRLNLKTFLFLNIGYKVALLKGIIFR